MQFQPRPYSFSMLRRTNSAIVENVFPDCDKVEEKHGQEPATIHAHREINRRRRTHRDLQLEGVLGRREHLLEHRVCHVLREHDGLVELVVALAAHAISLWLSVGCCNKIDTHSRSGKQ